MPLDVRAPIGSGIVSPPTAAVTTAGPAKIDVSRMNLYYGTNRVLEQITLKILPNQVTALSGPSGCGKSTFLRSLNRMNDIIPGTRVEGQVLIDDEDIYAPSVDVVNLRRRVGMVFQKSNPFPKSIFDNVAYGLRINGMAGSRTELEGRVEQSLQHAALWDEVKDRLHDSALAMSGGKIGSLHIPWAFRLDPLSSMMILVVTGIGFLIHVYSTAYMHDEPRGGVARYFAYLNLFCFFMLTLVLGANLIVLFVGREGVGLCS